MNHDSVVDITQLAAMVRDNDPASHFYCFHERIIKVFNTFPFHSGMIELAIHSVRLYGFGVLLLLRKMYYILESRNVEPFMKELYQIELMSGQLMENFPHDKFAELKFLKRTTKTQKRAIRTDPKQIFYKVYPSTKKRSRQIIQYILKLKQFSQQLSKVTEQTFHETHKILSEMKTYIFVNKPTLNIFDKIHQRHIFEDIIREINYMKRFSLKEDQLQFLNMSVFDIKSNRDYPEEPKDIYHGPRYGSESGEVITQSLDNLEEKRYFQDKKSQSLIVIDSDKTKENISIDETKKEYSVNPDSFHQQLMAHNSLLKMNPFRPLQKRVPICCRTSFTSDEVIEEAESDRRQYKNFAFPLTNVHLDIIARAMVGFLNYYGGTIYIGIKETKNKIRRVVGMSLNEKEKEDAMISIRQICKKVYPDIVLIKMYKIKFVPIKGYNGQYIRGKYIVKILVEMGKPKELYYYQVTPESCRVCFRTENEVLVRNPAIELCKIMEFYKNRSENPLKSRKQHEGDCPEPEVGLSRA